MNRSKEGERAALERLTDSLVDDILDASDADILEEFRELGGDPEANAAAMAGVFRQAVLAANKARLVTARAAMRAHSAQSLKPLNVTPADARRILRKFIDQSQHRNDITMAARKESDLSDADVLEALEDLRRLGVLTDDEGER